MSTPAQIVSSGALSGFKQGMENAEQQRQQKQNTVGVQLLDAINQSSSIKPQIKDPNTGELVDNPAYADAQNDRRTLMSQYAALNSPEQHASFGQHLHGLIFGKPTPHAQQPLLSTNSSPVQPSPDPAAPVAAQPPAPDTPLHPMAPVPADHPLHAITGGIKKLGEHLKAFANPLPPEQQPDTDLMAKYYRDPADVAFERNKELWGVRGENALAVAQERTKALMASLANRPPRMLSQVTIPNLLDEMKVDPDTVIYGPNGNELTPAQLSEMPPGTIARQFKAGPNVFYALGDQNSKTLNVAGHVYDIPAVGPINLTGPNANATPLGQATSTLPTQTTETSPGGAQVLKGTSEKIVPPVAPTPAPTPAPQPATPALKVRTQPTPIAAPVVPLTPKDKTVKVGTASIGDVAPNIQNMTQSNAAKAMKAQPAVTALLGMYGDPQLPQVKSMMDFSKLADDPHAQKVLGEAFKLLNQQMGEISDPGVISTLGTSMGWANFRANAEAQAQQQAGTQMTDLEKEYFNTAIASMADIIGSRSATGQSPARFSVQFMENEVPQIGTSSVTDQKSYLQKMLTIARQIKVGLNAMPDNSRANKWLLNRENELIKQSNQVSTKMNPKSSKAPGPPSRPAKVPEGWLFNPNGPKGRGWYAPPAK